LSVEETLDLKKLKIVDWAAFDSYENQQHECLPGTRVGLLRELEDWTTSPDGKCIFWLSGTPGTGKSTICRTFARQLKEKGLLGASFFFRRGEEDATKLFPTLIKQLVTRVPQMIPAFQEAVECDPGIPEKGLREQFNKLFLHPLLGIKQAQTTYMVIVIDALDECKQEDDIQVLLQLLPQVQRSNSVQLRFLLTSRPELPIRMGFRRTTSDHQDLVHREILRPEIEHDIRLYFEKQFSQLQQERSFPSDWPGDETIETLVAKSVPVFNYAATIYRYISDIAGDPEKRLRGILADQTIHMSQMDSIYMPVLNQLLAGQDRWETQRLGQEFKEIAGPIILLATPLSIYAFSQLMEMGTDDISRRLNPFHSVLDIPDNLDTPIRLLHVSFRDFLLDNGKNDSSPFWIDEKEVHENITTQCIKVMARSLKMNICNLSGYDTQRRDIGILSIRHCLPPELQYSCRNWAEHLMQSKDSARLLHDAFLFLKKHFLHWMEVMSILGVVFEVVEVIRRLQKGIQVSSFLKLSVHTSTKRHRLLKTLEYQNFFMMRGDSL
jgi:hypothetical protein